jgi:dephospho-CoA kinase
MIAPAVLTFSARQASGKSTVSTEVAEELGWPRAGFGDYLRRVAAERGLNPDREILQELGERFVRENLEQFCQDVLGSVGWVPGQGIVVDGIRHAQTMEVLRNIVRPMPVLLVYIDVPDAIRSDRLRARGVSEDLAKRHEEHSTEAQVIDTLPRLADLRVDGRNTVAVMKAEIMASLRKRMDTQR